MSYLDHGYKQVCTSVNSVIQVKLVHNSFTHPHFYILEWTNRRNYTSARQREVGCRWQLSHTETHIIYRGGRITLELRYSTILSQHLFYLWYINLKGATRDTIGDVSSQVTGSEEDLWVVTDLSIQTTPWKGHYILLSISPIVTSVEYLQFNKQNTVTYIQSWQCEVRSSECYGTIYSDK